MIQTQSELEIHRYSNSPDGFKLFQNYPNPFNPVTKITYSIPTAQYTLLKVYDALGKEVAVLINEKLNAGTYETEFDASALPSAVYFYKLTSGNYTETRKMFLLK